MLVVQGSDFGPIIYLCNDVLAGSLSVAYRSVKNILIYWHLTLIGYASNSSNIILPNLDSDFNWAFILAINVKSAATAVDAAKLAAIFLKCSGEGDLVAAAVNDATSLDVLAKLSKDSLTVFVGRAAAAADADADAADEEVRNKALLFKNSASSAFKFASLTLSYASKPGLTRTLVTFLIDATCAAALPDFGEGDLCAAAADAFTGFFPFGIGFRSFDDIPIIIS